MFKKKKEGGGVCNIEGFVRGLIFYFSYFLIFLVRLNRASKGVRDNSGHDAIFYFCRGHILDGQMVGALIIFRLTLGLA